MSIYPGSCRHKRAFTADHAVRIVADNKQRLFLDQHKGNVLLSLVEHFGDFIIWRRDNLVTYHLATAYDDGHKHSHVLRGDDLFEMTAPQLYLMEKLGLRPPEYPHPSITFPDGTKLSKQTHAPALSITHPEANLKNALRLLGQQPPKTSPSASGWTGPSSIGGLRPSPIRLSLSLSPIMSNQRGGVKSLSSRFIAGLFTMKFC